MSVIIGSARGNEYGGAVGGAAGDQRQTKKPDYAGEVSRENWYKHSKGWVLIRANNDAVRAKIAACMDAACDNANIGYDQNRRNTLYNAAKSYGFDVSKVAKKVDTDCSALVRVCCNYAGVALPDVTTASLVAACKATGDFTTYTAAKYTGSEDYLLRGDILVTATKGHTVVVLSDGSKAVKAATPSNTQTNTPTASTGGPAWLTTAYAMTTTALNLRKAPDGAILKVIPKGGLVSLTGEKDGKWVQAKYNDAEGWCSEKYLKTTVKFPQFGKCTAANVPVRVSPSGTAAQIKEVPLLGVGNEIDVLGVTASYYKIKIAGQHIGYVECRYIRLT